MMKVNNDVNDDVNDEQKSSFQFFISVEIQVLTPVKKDLSF